MSELSLPDVVSQLRRVAAPVKPPDAVLVAAFVSERSESAFRSLAERHGPMVFGVCQRVLKHTQDAEDALQAVFIVLARKAAAIRPPDAVGRWLYGTAVRTARKAKCLRDRRLRRHAEMARKQTIVSHSIVEPNDWQPVLDQELTTLPEKHRLPILLCDVMGRSRQEAAAELGINEGTLSSRLARARDLLRSRLVRKGVLPSAGAVTLGAAEGASAEPSNSLLESTVSACCGGATATISHTAIRLAEGVIRSMFLNKLQRSITIVSLVAILGATAWIGGSYLLADSSPPPTKETPVGRDDNAKTPPQAKGKPNDRSADRLTELRTARLKALKNQVDGLNARLEAGKDPLTTILDANKKLMEAELALCKTNEQRMAVYETAVKRFKVFEELTQGELEAGRRTMHEAQEARAARLEIEIMWEQVKSK